MNNKHRKTLATDFTDPVSGTVEWSAIEKLLIAAGADVIEGNGSRVRFVCVFRGIRPVIPTTSGHLNRGIRPPLFSGFEA